MPPDVPADPAKARELVYLSLSEQEVGATEDRALLEVALGGPDTSQRLRLIQRIKRLGTDARTCPDAVANARSAWAAQGLTFDPNTMRLDTSARLQVSFSSTGSPPDPCEPEAQGGYLGADNQLIRVQVTAWDPAANKGRLVWGFDDASFQYRVDVVNPALVELQSRPPDDLHEPRAGQAVELLRSAVRLDGAGEFVASATGVLQTLTSPYVGDTHRITLPVGLSPEYLDSTRTPVVFLRVWEEELDFTPGTPVVLDPPERPTGLRVTLTAPNSGMFHLGDFWLIGVRPAAPTQVYPERYLTAPQPPDGPRRWACPLAVVEWIQGVLRIIEDCRNPFDNLVELTARRQSGCCDVLVRPEDLDKTGLQAIVDRFAGKGQVTICLAPGLYALPQPLRLGRQHSHLTIEACHDGAVITAAAGAEDHFFDGLVVLDHADNVTLRGLRFHLPQVRFAAGGLKLTPTPLKMLAGATQRLNVTVGVRPVHCAVLTIEDCLFRYPLDPNKDCFGAGIFAQSECWGHRIRRNRFVRDDEYLRGTSQRSRTLFGYLLATTVVLAPDGTTFGSAVPALLQDSSFLGNAFSGLIAAVAVSALTGVVEIQNNTVRECLNGFIFLPMSGLNTGVLRNQLRVSAPLAPTATTVADLLATTALNPALHVGGLLARIYPPPQGVTLSNAVALEPPATDRDEEAETVALLTDLSQPMAAPGSDVIEGDREPAAGGEPIADQVRLHIRQATQEAARLGVSKQVFGRFMDAQTALAKLGRVAVGPPTERPLRLCLHLSGEDVETVIEDGPSGFGFLVFGDRAKLGDLTMVGCRFLGQPTGFLVTIGLIPHCAISGNLILNERAKPASLSVVPGAGKTGENVAVTGNMFQGRTFLPPRPLPAPLNTWDVFNAER